MNESELTLALSATLRVTSRAALRAGGYGAAPVATADGAARSAAFAGASLSGERVSTGVDVWLPLLGDPFTVKLSVLIGVRF